MSGPVTLLAAGPTTPATVDALKETLASLRAARAPKAAAAPGLGGLVKAPPGASPAPGDFVRELARREAAPPPPRVAAAPPPGDPDTIPPEILPLLFESGAFAPARSTSPPPEAREAPPAPARPIGAPLDLVPARAEPAGGPASTASAGPAAKPVEVDVERLARAPGNFMPVEVLQELKARHRGGALRPDDAPTGAARVR